MNELVDEYFMDGWDMDDYMDVWINGWIDGCYYFKLVCLWKFLCVLFCLLCDFRVVWRFFCCFGNCDGNLWVGLILYGFVDLLIVFVGGIVLLIVVENCWEFIVYGIVIYGEEEWGIFLLEMRDWCVWIERVDCWELWWFVFFWRMLLKLEFE